EGELAQQRTGVLRERSALEHRLERGGVLLGIGAPADAHLPRSLPRRDDDLALSATPPGREPAGGILPARDRPRLVEVARDLVEGRARAAVVHDPRPAEPEVEAQARPGFPHGVARARGGFALPDPGLRGDGLAAHRE